jgi:hypothetical protein
LVIEWEPGSDVVGDLVWTATGSQVVVSERALGVLKCFRGFEPGPVEMVDAEEVSKRGPRRSVVRLPYTGPRLQELWVTAWAHLSPERSSVKLERRCTTCGTEFWEVWGIEEMDMQWDPGRGNVRTKKARVGNQGIFVSEDQLADADIFRVHEFPAWTFCRESVREAVTEAALSNVSFFEIGETF